MELLEDEVLLLRLPLRHFSPPVRDAELLDMSLLEELFDFEALELAEEDVVLGESVELALGLVLALGEEELEVAEVCDGGEEDDCVCAIARVAELRAAAAMKRGRGFMGHLLVSER